jgi:predicted MFS family arabinose efflux permease
MSAIEGIAGSPARLASARACPSRRPLVLFMSVFRARLRCSFSSPVLVEVARDLDVSTAVAGQLRVFAAPVAALVAVLVVRSARRLGLRSLLCAGTALVAAGSLVSAAAPSFVVLALPRCRSGSASPSSSRRRRRSRVLEQLRSAERVVARALAVLRRRGSWACR